MSALARLAAAALCVSALAAPLAAFADAAPIDLATDSACRLDRVREIVAGATQTSASPEEANRLIVENTADWLPDYNAFATAPETADLLAASDEAVAAGKLSTGQCRQLLPFAAVSASALAVLNAGGAVEAGAVLATCDSGACLPASTAAVLAQCGVAPFSLPLQSTC